MNDRQVMVKMVFDRWYALLKNCDTLLNSLTDEQMLREIVPGKNRGIYLLGHLIAVHDDMLPILGLGDKQHPELFEVFIKSPDSKSPDGIPTVGELRLHWSKQNEMLKEKFDGLTADDWFGKHNSVSAEDFIKEPHRNKLNIILTRTTHLAYHHGQLMLIKQ